MWVSCAFGISLLHVIASSHHTVIVVVSSFVRLIVLLNVLTMSFVLVTPVELIGGVLRVVLCYVLACDFSRCVKSSSESVLKS